jgi:hypothetical protein
MLQSIKNHLKQKYYIHFASYDTYQEDLGKNIVGKKSYTTIYHNFDSNFKFIEKNGKPIKDQGEIGALIHAKIVKASKGYFEERIVCVDHDGKIIGFKKKNEFTPNDYMAVEVGAFKIQGTDKLILFERSPKKSQGRELLFQSGKITENDLPELDFKAEDKLAETHIKNAIIRELKEELDFDINADRISLLQDTTPIKQQRKDKMHWFSFYLAVIEVTEAEIKTFKPDYTISGIKRQYTDKDGNELKTDICVSSEAEKVNPAADEVFIKMFGLLKKRYASG